MSTSNKQHFKTEFAVVDNSIRGAPPQKKMAHMTHFLYALTLPNINQVLHKMFNVSALLLDDALKPATPLTNVFNCCF